MGVRIVDVRDVTSDHAGILREEFRPVEKSEFGQGNEAFGEIVAARIVGMLGREAATSPGKS